jgi:hypothetical protein
MLKMREFRDYLRYARKCLSLAEEKILQQEDAEWLLIPATILTWSSMESFVNGRCEDLKSLPSNMFELHETAFLQEKRLRFEDKGDSIGQFVIEGNEYQAIENKIFFLLSKMGSHNTTNLKGGALWQRFKIFKEARDSLLHPRRNKEIALDINMVKDFIETAQELIQLISERIWKKRLDF